MLDSTDPRDQLSEGIEALGGVLDLLIQTSNCKSNDLHHVRPDRLATLLEIISDRLERARDGFSGWRPASS